MTDVRVVYADALAGDLNVLQSWTNEINTANGWFSEHRTFGDEIALLHSEASEMLEAYRDSLVNVRFEFGIYDGDGVYRKVQLGPDDFRIRKHPDRELYVWTDGAEFEPGVEYPVGKPVGLPSEAADVLIRLLDTCQRHGIDLQAETVQKLEYNATRGHRHGGKVL